MMFIWKVVGNHLPTKENLLEEGWSRSVFVQFVYKIMNPYNIYCWNVHGIKRHGLHRAFNFLLIRWMIYHVWETEWRKDLPSERGTLRVMRRKLLVFILFFCPFGFVGTSASLAKNVQILSEWILKLKDWKLSIWMQMIKWLVWN